MLALARSGNASAAGRLLGVNASTVTRRVMSLEKHLQVQLFDRRASGMTPTPAGQLAVQTAQRVEEEILDVDAEIRGLDHELRGTLRISSFEALFTLWRAEMKTLHALLPRVEVVLSTAIRYVDLSRREADVALRLTTSPPDHLVGRRFMEVPLAIYASKALVDRITEGGHRIPSYADFPWVGWDEPFAATTDHVRAKLAPRAPMPFRVSSWWMLLNLIEDGVGVSLLPCFVGDRLPNVARLGSFSRGGLYLWALTHEPLRRAARVRVFMDFVAELMKRDADLFSGKMPAEDAIEIS